MQVRSSACFIAIFSALLLGFGPWVCEAFESGEPVRAESPQPAEEPAAPAELPIDEPGDVEPVVIEDEVEPAPLDSDEEDEPSADSGDEADSLAPGDPLLPLPADDEPADE
ncbi:MAG: hypothetical protein WD403_00185, partial [Pirellulales bacterium]